MKQYIFFCLSFLLFSASYAQIKVGTTLFEGREVKVYPYRVNFSSSDSYNGVSTDNSLLEISAYMEIPYCPLLLPDGEYIVYYPKENHTTKKGKVYYARGDTDNVAIHFYISNGKKNGTAHWYSSELRHKKIYLGGEYNNDIKEGEWNCDLWNYKEKFHYKNGLLDGEVKVFEKRSKTQTTFSITKGLLNGRYISFNEQTKDSTEIDYADGMVTGSYYFRKHKTNLSSVVSYFDDESYFHSGRSVHLFNTIEIRGTIFKNLKYGTWNIQLDKRRLALVFDTIKTLNNNNSSSAFSSFRISYEGQRYQHLRSGDKYYSGLHSERYDDDGYEWQWDLRYFIMGGAGYFTEYDIKGNILNADSFCNAKLKIPFIIKDENGITRCALQQVPRNDSLYNFQKSVNNVVYKITYAFIKDTLTKIESTEEYFNKDRITSLHYHRTIDYYKFYHQTAGPTVLIDSTVWMTKNNIPQKRLTFVDIFSGVSFFETTEYGGYSYPPSSEVQTDTIKKVQNVLYISNIGDLTIIDTTIIPLKPGLTIFTGLRSRDRWEWNFDRPHKKMADDSIHICFLWKNEPMRDDLSIKIRDREYAIKPKVKKRYRGNENNTVKAGIGFFTLNKIFNLDYHSQPRLIVLSIKDGKLSGPQEFFSGKEANNSELLYSANFEKNLKNGDETDRNGTNQKTHYVNGAKDGLIMKKSFGRTDYIVEYKQGLLNGQFMDLNGSEQPAIKCQFINDTLNGLYEDYDADHQVINTAYFRNGLIDGKYYRYQYLNLNQDENNAVPKNQTITYCNSRQVKTIELKFRNGVLVDTARYYHCDGILKATIEFDSAHPVSLLYFQRGEKISYYNSMNKNFVAEIGESKPHYNEWPVYNGYNTNNEFGFFAGRISLDFYSNIPGYYKLYYKSGVPSQEGRINESGVKTGWWKFWNENGALMKEILYERGYIIDPLNGTDTIKYTGKIKGYYPNGKFMMEGYVLDEDFKYECVQDEDIAYQKIYYLKFYDENGNDVFKNYSGFVRDYNINGNIREEGSMLNGKRNGIWKMYESNGNLNSIGVYKNGMKEGLWISGDLKGIGFIDNQCFEGVIDFSKIKGNLDTNQLEFEETIYEAGKIIKQTTHRVNLDGSGVKTYKTEF